jgi:CRISPR-associated endonuclease/helicase Cas3
VKRHREAEAPLAHSPPQVGAEGDPYARHVGAVRCGARERVEAMLRHATNPPRGLLEVIDAAATFHDLGKLDPDTQAALRKGRGSRLRWDHIDAGVAQLSAVQDWMAAWLVRAHHAPGLPEKQAHFNADNLGWRLRGRRRDEDEPERHEEQIARTNAHLRDFLELHGSVIEEREAERRRPVHGLPMRLALSCLVDADHSDTAFFDTGRLPPEPSEPRWAERLEALCRYVRGLPAGKTDAERARNRRRAMFFDACLNARIEKPMVACEGPVGLGKTTAVAAYLIRRAQVDGLRRLIVVAPYTNILAQTSDRLRNALVLPGERPDHVVVEHHHRADFEHESDRDLAVLWRAPVILTTAVSFFETLAACDPASLRKLHAVPGSAIFLDEAHAALPTKLWPQNWRWLRDLAERWGCRFVFASGSLARFWEDDDIVGEAVTLPELLPRDQAIDVLSAERNRVRYVRPSGGRVLSLNELIEHVDRAAGPRLVILNTVQNAAVAARAMQDAGLDALHLSTALAPQDRDCVLKRVKRRLEAHQDQWTLVATSCVEAGVDLSFRCAFRERFATASTIQVGGRVNRHGEYDSDGGGVVYDFALDDVGITKHPGAAVSSDVLRDLMAADELNRRNPADVVTKAMREELSARGGLGADPLLKAEAARDYPSVKKYGRVIDADTRIVVVDEHLKKQLAERQLVDFQDLLRGSVQIWATNIHKLAIEEIPGRREIYSWTHDYDPDFLGYMAGVFQLQRFINDPEALIL